jgi:hypothetical protein
LQQTLPVVSFVNASAVVNEDVGTTTVLVELSQTYTATVQVPFQVLDGTAARGVDFSVSPASPLTFAAGQQTRTITVTIVDDTIDEPNENFYIQLVPPVVNGTIGSPSTFTMTIIDNDAPASGSATPVYTDVYEPNNTLQEAYTMSSGTKLCAITLWPIGDLDYFRFIGKAGSYYIVSTTDLVAGVDTALVVYNPQGNQIASNDDFEVGSRRSQVTIAAGSDGYYYARIENRDPSDPANKTYCFQVQEVAPPTPTPMNTPPPLGTDDVLCEFNSTLEFACTIGLDRTLAVPRTPTCSVSG